MESRSVSIHQTASTVGSRSVVILPYFENDTFTDVLTTFGMPSEAVSAAIERREVRSKPYSTTLFHSDGSSPAMLIVGAGTLDDWDGLRQLRLASAAVSYLLKRGYTDVAFVHRGNLPAFDFARAAVQGAVRGPYDPGIRKTKRDDRLALGMVALVSDGAEDDLQRGAAQGRIVGEATNLARDLVNLPANDLTPSTFAARAQQLADANGLGCEILDEVRIRELGMGAILGVASGSAEPPRVIVLRYGPTDSPVKLAYVGKGLTFDSGGLSLKTADGMMTMKGDMGGAAAVVAAMVAIAQLGIGSVSVTAYVGATENMPSGSAMRPGDVLTALNGETIEVLNTDAEGRLVLADVLSYAVQQGATHIVDAATLTGGAVVALGHECTLAAGKPMTWVHSVVAAAGAGLERAWAMPLFDEYRRAMDSEVADIKNTGGRYASALTASAFLADFVGDAAWTHLDVAGSAWADKATPYEPIGGTGAGVGTFVSLAQEMSRHGS